MQFRSQVTVTGIKKFKGEIEGKDFDSTTAFIQLNLDDSKGTARGAATQDYNIGTSDEFDKLSKIQLPFEAEALFELVTSGKAQRQRILSLTPVQHRAPTKAAA